MVIDEVGYWLERVLHQKNTLRGDSPKIAGCMDLLRVQGRWAAAARLGWIRGIAKAPKDIAGGEKLEANSPNSCPGNDYWEIWARLFEKTWQKHINNIVKVGKSKNFDTGSKYYYQLDSVGISQFVNAGKTCTSMYIHVHLFLLIVYINSYSHTRTERNRPNCRQRFG